MTEAPLVRDAKRPSVWKRGLIGFAVATAVLLVLLLLAGLVQRVAADAKLKAAMTDLKADGIPTSWAAYQAQFPDIERHLAAQSNMFAALDQLSRSPELSDRERTILPIEGLGDLPEPDAPLSTQMVSAIESRLNQVSTALDAVRRAVAEEPFWLALPTSSTGMVSISHLSGVRQAARLYKMAAVLRAERGDTDAALAAVADGMRLAEVPHRGSLMIDELVRFACEGIAVQSLEFGLARTDPPPDGLRAIDALLSQCGDSRSGMLGELIYSIRLYEAEPQQTRGMAEQYAAGRWQRVLVRLPESTGWLRMNEAYSLALLRDVMRAWDLPWAQFQIRCRSAAERIPRLYFVADSSKDIYPAIKNRELRARGARDCARLAIAIERYAQAEGALPGALADLKPKYLDEVPSEPFYGKPFSYTRTGSKGVISFPYPDSELVFAFKVYVGREKEKTQP